MPGGVRFVCMTEPPPLRDDAAESEVSPPTQTAMPSSSSVSIPPVSERPFSHQAEEGSADAAPDERPPYDVVPRVDTLGTRHIEEALSDLEFPISRFDLLARAGAWRVPVTGAHFRTLGEYLADVDDRAFRSPVSVTRAIERAWRRRHTHA